MIDLSRDDNEGTESPKAQISGKIRKVSIGERVMSKEQKSKKESKKTKVVSEETKKSKKEKKDPKRHDGPAK
jgi:hypothetical protein